MLRFLEAMQHALDGIWYGLKTQRNLRFHFVATTIVIGLGLYQGLDSTEWMVLLLLIGAVISAELVNTAIEAVVDLVSPDFHPLAKAAKDIAAGAVLVLAIVAAVIGIMLFLG